MVSRWPSIYIFFLLGDLKVLNNVKIRVFSDNLRSRLLFVSSIQLRKTYLRFQTRTYKYLPTKDSQYKSSGINTDYFNDLLFSTVT